MSKFVKVNDLIKNNKTINVINVDKDNLNNVKDVDSNSEISIDQILGDYYEKPEILARQIADKLNDSQNLNLHLRVVKANNPHKISLLFEALSITLDASRSGKINRGTKGGYYVGVLRNKGVQW